MSCTAPCITTLGETSIQPHSSCSGSHPKPLAFRGEVAIEIEMGNPEKVVRLCHLECAMSDFWWLLFFKGTSIGNTLRSLFLHSEVDLDTLTYTTPRFTDTMNRAVGSRGTEDVGERSIWHHKQKEWLLNLKERVISPNGVLTWRGEDVERLWKRDSNVLRDLWQCRLVTCGEFDLILSFKSEGFVQDRGTSYLWREHRRPRRCPSTPTLLQSSAVIISAG